MTDVQQTPDSTVGRRVVLRGVAIGGAALPVLAACGGGDDDGSSDAGSDKSTGSGGSASSGATVSTADVPVGGGSVVKADKVVVTQPEKGQYKAFTAVCTHQGCLVAKVEKNQIICPCHNSHFSATDGSVQSGPAKGPLSAKKVAVKGDQITVT